jgi:hypothetical protein
MKYIGKNPYKHIKPLAMNNRQPFVPATTPFAHFPYSLTFLKGQKSKQKTPPLTMLLQQRLFLASHAIQAVPASGQIDKYISFIVPETSGLLTPFAVASAKANLLPYL